MPDAPRLPGLRRLFRVPRRSVEQDIDDELKFHVESRVQELMRLGMSATAAQHAAETEFGDLAASRHELAAIDRHRQRRERVANVADGVIQDLRHALRSLGRAHAFTATAITTLVLGVGAVVAIFAVIDPILVEPLPFPHAERLVGAWHDFPPIALYHAQQSAATFLTYRSQARTIEDIGVYLESAVNVGEERSANPPARVASASCTASLFNVLGVPAARGRVFGEADDRPGAAPVMVISNGMWHTRFGADPAIVGRRVDVNGVRREIVGIMPPDFRFPSAETQIWIPLGFDPKNLPATAFSYNGVARLKAGVTVAAAQRDFTAVLPRVSELFPNFVPGITTRQIMEQTKPHPVLRPLRDDVTGAIAGTLWMMGAAALLLFIVACINVATLTLVRFDARQRELAVCAALGAGRGRVLRYQFSESALIAVIAGIVGILLAWVAVRSLVRWGPADIPRLTEVGIDSRVLIFALALTAVATITFSALPALRILAGHVRLREEARGGTTGRQQQRVRSALVSTQIAFGVVVLTTSGLLLRSFGALRAVRPGFDGEHVATMWISLPQVRYPTPATVVRFYGALVDRIAALPMVKSVGVTSHLPLEARGANPNPLYPEDAPEWSKKLPPLQVFTNIGGGYLEALRIPIIAGRGFEALARQHEMEALISRQTASFFWHDTTGVAALGKRFRALPTDPLYTIVGVVEDTRDSTLAAPPSPTVYLPILVRRDSVERPKSRTMALVVRTTGGAGAAFGAVQRVVHELDPTLPTFDARPMTSVVRASTSRLAFTTLILAAAAVVTVLLGAVGLYGVLAYLVTLRRRELGIRIALGASPPHIAASLTRHGLMLAGVGTLLGLAVLVIAARGIRGFLFGVTAWDPLAVGGSTLLLFAVTIVASWFPARRASRVDPAEALRAD